MARYRRSTPLAILLIRLGWQRDPNLWVIPCRDIYRRRARLCVHMTFTGVVITPSNPGPILLTAFEIGQLRKAIQDAVLTFDRLAGAIELPRGAQGGCPIPPGPPPPRKLVQLLRTRPSVADLVKRYAASRSDDQSMPLANVLAEKGNQRDAS